MAIGLLAVLLLTAAPSSVTVGVLADPVTLKPHQATDFVSAEVLANVCETLVRFRPGVARPEGVLATTWATADGRTWTFTIREGVRFQDGAPLDSDAVVANFADLTRVRGFRGTAERIGPYAVSITLDRPNTAFLSTLSQPFYALESPRGLSAPGGPPVGTGPFAVGQAKPGLIRLTANPAYWGGPPRVAEVLFRRLSSQEALLQELLAHSVDVTSALDPAGVERVRKSPDLVLEIQKGLNICLLSLNNDRPPFSDRRVRQAIARALDPPRLVAQALAGRGEPVHTPFPPSLFAVPGSDKWARADRSAARRLLAEAGYRDGFLTTLLSVNSPRPYMPDPRGLAAEVRAELASVGIRVELQDVPTWPEYAGRGSRGEYDMALFGWQADTMDPNDFLSALLASESIGGTNRSRYRDAEMDALLKRGRREQDPSVRGAVYKEIEDLFQRDMPFVPLFSVSVFTGYSRALHGLALDPTGLLRFGQVSKD
jgi:peptide/nickel transport system substrate-binding protein